MLTSRAAMQPMFCKRQDLGKTCHPTFVICPKLSWRAWQALACFAIKSFTVKDADQRKDREENLSLR
jgi:hypothetical protein